MGAEGQGLSDERAKRLLECWRKALLESDGNRRSALDRVARELGLKKAELSRRLAELDP